MSEEEKKAVEFIRDLITWDIRQYLCPNKEECKNLEIILNLIEKLQKENNRLRYENCRLKTIRYATDFGTESIHLIPESDLVEINTNRYMIEIENGNFVDLKQVYQENIKLEKANEELHKEIDRMKSLDIYKLVEDSETGQLIPRQKIKDKIEKLKKANFNDYTKEQDGNEVKMKILYEFKKLLESE